MPFVESFHMFVVGTLLGRMAYALYRRMRYVANGQNKWANAIRPYWRKMRFVSTVPFGAIVSFWATTRVAPTGGIYGALRPNNRITK
jgi:hypothetical protein